ncbi:hypothetical protein D8S78_11340 [Natrialba swarupiae]|nr:hypothetical protein [Natrialba swarupiae]
MVPGDLLVEDGEFDPELIPGGFGLGFQEEGEHAGVVLFSEVDGATMKATSANFAPPSRTTLCRPTKGCSYPSEGY